MTLSHYAILAWQQHFLFQAGGVVNGQVVVFIKQVG
jgi:hypothetical protein